MIRVEGLSHVYPGNRKQAPRTAIHDLSLTVPTESFCILSGPNGSGKSTLFRLLCGLSTPTAGRLMIDDIDLVANPAAARANLGVVFQSPAVDKHLSIRENLNIHADLHGIRGADRTRRMEEALNWTDIENRLHERVDTLSGGLMRQVELAKVLMTDPAVLLLDEPTTGLDPASRRRFLKALIKLQQARKMTVLMTSHVFTEADNADSVAIMNNGTLLAHDTPKALKAMVGKEMLVIEPADQETAAALCADLKPITAPHVPSVFGDEIRVEDIAPGKTVDIIGRVLEAFRGRVASVAVKEPSLEDVFIHITGKGLTDMTETAGEDAPQPAEDAA